MWCMGRPWSVLTGDAPAVVTQCSRRQKEAAPPSQFLHQLTANTCFGHFGTYQAEHSVLKSATCEALETLANMRFYYIKHSKNEMS